MSKSLKRPRLDNVKIKLRRNMESTENCNESNYYQPHDSKSLALHHSKTKSIKIWLQQTTNDTSQTIPHVLVLIGPSGCGKSTAVEILCQEMNIEIKHISSDNIVEEVLAGSMGTISIGMSMSANNISYTKTNDRLDRVNEWEEFVVRSNYPTLPLLSSSSSSSSSSTANKKQICLMHDSPDILSELMGSERRLFSTISNTTSSSHRNVTVSNLLNTFLSPYQPLVIIVSDVIGQDDVHFALSNIIPHDLRNRIVLETIFCFPITAIQTKKALLRVLIYMNKNMNRSTKHGFNQHVPMNIVEEIAETSGGDVRHAIVRLQLQVQSQVQVYSLQDNLTDKTSLSSKMDVRKGNKARKVTYENQKLTLSTLNRKNNKLLRMNSNMRENDQDREERVEFDDDSDEPSTTNDTDDHKSRSKLVHSFHPLPWTTNKNSDRKTRSCKNITQRERISDDIENFISDDSDNNNNSNNSNEISEDEDKNTNSRNGEFGVIKVNENDSHDQSSKNRYHRDEELSSLHSVGKLLNARLDNAGQLDFSPDRVFSSSQLPPEVTIQFIQWNVIDSIMNIARMATYLNLSNDQSTDDLGLQQIEASLRTYSDADIIATMKYNPSAHIERNTDIASFPSEYVSALVSRATIVSRGIGCKEIIEHAKKRGAKHLFSAIHRPKLFDMRNHRLQVEEGLKHIRNEYTTMETLNYPQERKDVEIYHGDFISSMEMATELIPYLRLLSNPLSTTNHLNHRREDVIYRQRLLSHLPTLYDNNHNHQRLTIQQQQQQQQQQSIIDNVIIFNSLDEDEIQDDFD